MHATRRRLGRKRFAPRVGRSLSRRLVFNVTTWLALTLSTACGSSTIGEAIGPADTTHTNPGGTVQRGAITLRVLFDAVDAATASTAGVSLQGLQVSLLRSASTDPAILGTTDASGTAAFKNLLEGRYDVGVTRALTTTELSRLPINERDATTFAGGAAILLSAGQIRTNDVTLVRARRGSLVISEFFRVNGPPLAYPWGDYIEVYNNSDSLIFLDGKMLAGTYGPMHSETLTGCASTARFRTDTERVWVSHVWQFPGAGQDYPIRPGEGQVMAMDAINHVAASGQSKYQDLSQAQFEQVFTDADVDNPFSTNMINLFFRSTGNGHGYSVPVWASIVLMNNVPKTAWTSARIDDPIQGEVGLAMQGIPIGAVLDVASTDLSPAERASQAAIGSIFVSCQPWIQPQLDRGEAALIDYVTPLAIRRRSLGYLPNGQEILQRTLNSSRDFEFGEALRRSLKK